MLESILLLALVHDLIVWMDIWALLGIHLELNEQLEHIVVQIIQHEIYDQWLHIQAQVLHLELHAQQGKTTSSAGASSCYAIWGDGLKLPEEAWDDGNNYSDDGCSATWILETGFIWSGGSISSKDICLPICGDGIRVKGEECDDHNVISGDGWSSSCKVEPGYKWTGGSSMFYQYFMYFTFIHLLIFYF